MHARVVRASFSRTVRSSGALPLAAIRRSLARAERLLEPAPRVAKAKVPRVVLVPPAAPLPARTVPWEPPITNALTLVPRPRRDEALVLQEINGCKTLLLEIIRRAAYDWVLYRASRKLIHKTLADQAFQWLFKEVSGSADWEERQREGKHITGFVAICESLDLDPDAVRHHIQRLTPRNVTSVGRPAEYRRRDVFPAHSSDEDAFATPGLPGGISLYEDTGSSEHGDRHF
jgi:hypothetical protein